ncbi:MAG TPA: acyl-CoA dehydrogenase, partial [Syntrophomonadaceae bacterium]|nr:acyl-CoA dehydrogenase [Syntrophomonadaceae bacterium]
PKKYGNPFRDQETNDLFRRTIDFFENKGLQSIKEDDEDLRWCDDFLQFNQEAGAYAKLLTPAGYGDPDARFDMNRIAQFNEILAFYGLSYQYNYQVSILGLGPIWMGDNEEVKHKTGQLLKEGGIFAFGLSEKEHGADLYSNEMKLIVKDDGTYSADGDKYYIGNGNKAALVSTSGKLSDTGEDVFFVVESEHPNYECIKKINTSGNRPAYVAEYSLHNYPITEKDVLTKGKRAWDSALNTINVGKFQLGFASIGICTHAFYEAINHAHNRYLYGDRVTKFPHIRKLFTESYVRLVAMRLYALRAIDYFRSASDDDRRYLLYNPIQKMKVTTQGMKVVDMLLDIIAAKGFEQDTYMEMAIRDVGMIPRLEGTTHVNMALVIKFMENYLFNNVEFADLPTRDDIANDDYILNQKAGSLRGVKFPDYMRAYTGITTANIEVFKEQIEVFRDFLANATPDAEQAKNVDYMLAIGEVFTMIAYAQLILENAKVRGIALEVVDEIFNFIVRDTSAYALAILSNFKNSEKQSDILMKLIRIPVNSDNNERVWNDHVLPLYDTYRMND